MSVVFNIARFFSYKHSNTLVKTWGVVGSFTLTKQLLLNTLLKADFSSAVRPIISPEVTILLTGFKVPENLNDRYEANVL